MDLVKHILDIKGHKVYAIDPGALVFDALRRMADNNVGSLVVLEDEKLVGIITERAYAREIALKGRTSSETLVADVMSTHVPCVRPEQTVEECMAIMTKRAVRHLPVLQSGHVIGIVSIGDMVNSIISDQQFVIEELEHFIHGER
jgi:CBS domain-containing protein